MTAAHTGRSTAPLLRAIEAHLASRDVARIIYGTIIGLAVVVALQEHPPAAGVVGAIVAGTALAVGFAHLYGSSSPSPAVCQAPARFARWATPLCSAGSASR